MRRAGEKSEPDIITIIIITSIIITTTTTTSIITIVTIVMCRVHAHVRTLARSCVRSKTPPELSVDNLAAQARAYVSTV